MSRSGNYKTAIVAVSGGRARGHAEAYAHIPRGTLAAISTRRREKLDEFGDRYGIAARYTDYAEMFEKEKPDLVHVNTPPDVRLEVMEAAGSAGVPSLIVEKPIAVAGEDLAAIRAFAERESVKVAVNHQLHFHPRRQMLQKSVADGVIGDVRFVEASCGMNMAYQGTHTLQAISAFKPDVVPVFAMGQVAGGSGLADTPKKHFAPDACEAVIGYDDGSRATLASGPIAPRVGDPEKTNVHKRVAVFGTKGFAHWTMWGWELSVDGKLDGGAHAYPDEDILGQAAMTEAMFDWLEDDAKVHPLNLDAAVRDYNTVLGIYLSALEHRPVDLPCDPGEGLIDRLRERLCA